jgi:hypothetical protein
MTVDVFRLAGEYSSAPTVELPPGLIAVAARINEHVLLNQKITIEYTLTGDTPVPVSFGSLASVSVLVIRATGGKVRVRITSADGNDQAIPADPWLILLAGSVPITAIDLTRVAGVQTSVEAFLGEAA